MQITSLLSRMTTLPAWVKTGIVAGGYMAAILIASGVVAIFVKLSGPERDASSGMAAFGEMLLFVAVFGVVSIVPTALALFFLRQCRRFWWACSVLALIIGGTSLAAVGLNILVPTGMLSGSLGVWAMFAFLRIFLSPFLAVSFALSALIAPTTGFRWCLFAAASMEAVSSLYGFFHWFAPLLFG